MSFVAKYTDPISPNIYLSSKYHNRFGQPWARGLKNATRFPSREEAEAEIAKQVIPEHYRVVELSTSLENENLRD